MWPCIVTNFFIIKPTRCTNFTNLFWHETTCFGQFLCPSWPCSKAVYKPIWHIPLLSVQWINSWWWTEELSETCTVSCQNKFVKLVHLVGFIVMIPDTSSISLLNPWHDTENRRYFCKLVIMCRPNPISIPSHNHVRIKLNSDVSLLLHLSMPANLINSPQ